MSLNGQLELIKNEEKSFGFLSFMISESQVANIFVLTARLTNDKDKKKYKKWECDAVIGLSCQDCQFDSSVESQPRTVVTTNAPSCTFLYQASNRCRCRYPTHRFILSVFLHDKSLSELKYEDTSARFTDEAEAKKLNANLKILFEDSEGEPIFANRELLTVYSNVFRAMFEGDFLEKNAEEVKLEAKREDFLSFLDCLYFPPVPVTRKNFKAVLIVADRYDCPQLLEKCKKFAEEEAETAATVQECKDFIEMADRYGWKHVVTASFDALKTEGRSFLMQLLDYDWTMSLKKNTRHALFTEMQNILPSDAAGHVYRHTAMECFKTTTRFTDEAEAKELNANCKIRCEDSDEPVFVNRSFLTIYSKVIRVVFEGNFKEKDAEEVKLGVKREDFLSFLDCLYYPPVPVKKHNFKAVALIADQYDCPQLLKNCKEFAEGSVETVSSVNDCEDYIEVSELLHWDNVLMGVISSMKKLGFRIFMELLDSEWIEEREENTQQALFTGLKEVIAAHLT